MTNNYEYEIEWASILLCLTPTQQFYSYIMARTR